MDSGEGGRQRKEKNMPKGPKQRKFSGTENNNLRLRAQKGLKKKGTWEEKKKKGRRQKRTGKKKGGQEMEQSSQKKGWKGKRYGAPNPEQ